MPKISQQLENFSEHSQNALNNATILALENGQAEIKPEHLLYGLLKEKGSIGCELLQKMEMDAEKLKKFLISINGKEPKQTEQQMASAKIKPSKELKNVIKKTLTLAYLYKHKYIGTEHLLAGLIQSHNPIILNIFQHFKISLKSIENQVILVLKGTSKFPDITETFQNLKDQALAESGTGQPNILEYFATEITSAAHQKKVEHIFCREEEIERLIEILMRKSKNNPILLGDPGVGKTAIVEGLAKRIYEKNVPDLLLNKKIIALDLSAVVAGAMYRGDFEARLKQIIEEVSNDSDKILFIDEIHTIIGAGAAMGSLDAANILKPALARGEIRCIGATTHDDFRKNIEKDKALARRFQPIFVKEPHIEKTIQILTGAKTAFEKYHRVQITNEAVTAAAQLADRYITDRFFPDKALDLLDEAAAAVRLKRGLSLTQKKINQIKNALTTIATLKREAILDENFDEASKFKVEEDKLIVQITDLQKTSNKTKISDKITGVDIKKVVSKITGIPLNEMIKNDREKLLNLELELNNRVIGQTEAVAALTQAIKRNRAGLSSANRPIGSFVFLGPSGVGKTETAKALAEIVFEDPKALIRLDMSEYSEKFNISKLIGAPAGYVGYEESGMLSEQVRRRPYSVVLFDEFEKAHPEVFNLLLQILDNGFITDSAGRQINFRNTIIILTSNLGSERLNEPGEMGFGSTISSASRKKGEINWTLAKEKMAQSLKDNVKPELINRFDQVVLFNGLTREGLGRVLKIKLNELSSKLARQNIELQVTPKAQNFILEHNQDSILGGRLIEKNIASLIENQLADIILQRGLGLASASLAASGDVSEETRSKITVLIKGKKLIFS